MTMPSSWLMKVVTVLMATRTAQAAALSPVSHIISPLGALIDHDDAGKQVMRKEPLETHFAIEGAPIGDMDPSLADLPGASMLVSNAAPSQAQAEETASAPAPPSPVTGSKGSTLGSGHAADPKALRDPPVLQPDRVRGRGAAATHEAAPPWAPPKVSPVPADGKSFDGEGDEDSTGLRTVKSSRQDTSWPANTTPFEIDDGHGSGAVGVAAHGYTPALGVNATDGLNVTGQDNVLSNLAPEPRTSAVKVLFFGFSSTAGLFASGILACMMAGRHQEQKQLAETNAASCVGIGAGRLQTGDANDSCAHDKDVTADGRRRFANQDNKKENCW